LFDPFKPIESRYARSASYFKDAEQSPTKAMSRPSANDETCLSFDSISQIGSTPVVKTTLLTDDLSEITVSSDLSPPQNDMSAIDIQPVLTLTPAAGRTYYNASGYAQSKTALGSLRKYPVTPSSSSRNKYFASRTPASGESYTSSTKSVNASVNSQRPHIALDPTAVHNNGMLSTVTRVPFNKFQSSSEKDASTRRVSQSFSSQISDSSVFSPGQYTQTPARAFAKLLSCLDAGKATVARQMMKAANYPMLTPAEASVLILKCAEDPDSLAEPLDTFIVLVEELGADVNSVDASGKNLAQILFANPFIGRYLMSKGADILADDSNGWCALSMSFEFGVEWMYEAFNAEGEAELLNSGDQRRILKYVSCLINGGYCTHVREILSTGVITVDSVLATELLLSCQGNFDNMKEPIETFELLESLGASVS
jgi:hypothetical protein